MFSSVKNMFSSKRGRLLFIYSERQKLLGSTVMRGKQLSEIASKTLSDTHQVRYVPLSSDYKKSIIFLTKGAILACSVKALLRLKQNKNIVIFDPVDSILPSDKAELAHAIVASSRTALKNYKKLYPESNVILIDHHVDPRIMGLQIQNEDNFRAGYFGELVNTVKTPRISQYVEFISVDTHKQDPEWISRLPYYNFHYAIRNNRSLDGYKPFLKGFTAAFCSANILIQSSEAEAVEWLGEDYPYLLKGEVNEQNIVATLEKAKKSYGTQEWYNGLKRMNEIKLEISRENISKQINDMIHSLNYNSSSK